MDLDGGKKKGSRKIKWAIIGAVVGILLIIMMVAIVGSGVAAVGEFFSDMGEKIGDFFTGEEALEQVSDPNLVTDEDLERWMINREAMVYLLEETEEFNNREVREKTFNIEGRRSWSEYEPSPTPAPPPTSVPDSDKVADTTEIPTTTTSIKPTAGASPTPAPTPTPFIPAILYFEEIEATAVSLCEDQTLVDRYKVDWQLAYLLCVYRFIDGEREYGGVVNVSTYEVEQILETIKPEIVYEFDPIEYWKHKSTLTEGDVIAHPHDVVEYDEHVTAERVVGGVVHHKRYIPKFRVKEVLLLYARDVYEYRYIPIGNGEMQEVLTYHRVYDKDRFLSLITPYLGTRDVETFLIALSQVPGLEGVTSEIRTMFEEE